jgi:hypothetical protein
LIEKTGEGMKRFEERADGKAQSANLMGQQNYLPIN